MSEALRRYPNIGEAEREDLIRFLTEASSEEIEQATSIPGLEPRRIAFVRDHPEHFGSGGRKLIRIAGALLALLAATLWWGWGLAI